MKLQHILDIGIFYILFQKSIGAAAVRQYFVDNYVKPKPGQKVLDIACGTGNMLPFLPAVNYFGIDSNQNYIRIAQRRFNNRGRFICQSISDNISPEISDFDIAIGFGIIHHLNDEESYQLFCLAVNALKPGGRFVTLDGCFRSGRHDFSHWMNRLDRGKFVRTKEEYTLLAHKVFQEVQAFDYCGKLFVPLDHCVLICEKPFG